ncbi:MAG: Wzt carbohydrate-binding domain-containing protein, partial [Candidatus Omnitrophota bacterium]
HLEPEILLVDEVLAVGDAAFQKKCLGKMDEVAKGGRTVLFVSHNMDAVQRLCPTSIFLENGHVQLFGQSAEVVNTYLKTNLAAKTRRKWENKENAPGDGIVRLQEVNIHTQGGTFPDTFDITQPIGITMDYEVLEAGHVFTHGCNLFNEKGAHIFSSHDVTSALRSVSREKGCYAATVWIPANLLAEGIITVSVAIFKPGVVVHVHEFDAVTFKVVDNLKEKSARGEFSGDFPGIIRPLLTWEAVKIHS